MDENDKLPESTNQQAAYKTTLLHHYPYQKGVGADERNKNVVDPVVHVDSEECLCNPIVMVWMDIWVRLYDSISKRNVNKKVGRWVNKIHVPAIEESNRKITTTGQHKKEGK